VPESATSASGIRSERLKPIIKARAGGTVESAIKRGQLARPENCEHCGKHGPVHAHHDDYSKPLVVRWLCSKCHGGWHAEHGEGENADVEWPEGNCLQCGHPLPPGSRSDRKYCTRHCRRMAFDVKIHQGRVRSVNLLKSGLMSVTYHIRESKRRPGDVVAED